MGAFSGWIKGSLGALALMTLAACDNSPHPHGAERENALYLRLIYSH